jgi:transposase-like protein
MTEVVAGTRFEGFDDKIVSLYARGMSVREIQGI